MQRAPPHLSQSPLPTAACGLSHLVTHRATQRDYGDWPSLYLVQEKKQKFMGACSMRAIISAPASTGTALDCDTNRVLGTGFDTEKRQAEVHVDELGTEVDLIIYVYASFSFHHLQQHQRGSLRHHRCDGIQKSGPKAKQPGIPLYECSARLTFSVCVQCASLHDHLLSDPVAIWSLASEIFLSCRRIFSVGKFLSHKGLTGYCFGSLD